MVENPIIKFRAKTEEDTYNVGKFFGENAYPNLVITLDGEMGAGKTLFSKGVGAGLNIEEHITSPTFNIIKQYLTGKMPFYHMDIYRISDEYELEEIGVDDCFMGNGLSVVEWAELLGSYLPEDRIEIKIEKIYNEDGSEYRDFTIECIGNIENSLKEKMENVDFSNR